MFSSCRNNQKYKSLIVNCKASKFITHIFYSGEVQDKSDDGEPAKEVHDHGKKAT